MPAAIMAVAVVLMAMAPAAIAWTSSTGIQMSSGLTGWGGFPLGGSGEGGGAAFDPVAAAKAMLTGAWTDKDFQNALISYAMATSQNKFSSTTPTFMEFLEQAYTSSGGTGSVQFQAVQQLAEEGKTLGTGDAQEQTIFNNLLQDAYTTVDSWQATSSGGQTALQEWCKSVYGGATDVYNKELGLWYDASAGNIKYLGGNGEPLNLVSGDATGYMEGMVTSSSDVSVCKEAFGADSWLNDTSAGNYGMGSSSGSNSSSGSSSSFNVSTANTTNTNTNNTNNTNTNTNTNNTSNTNNNSRKVIYQDPWITSADDSGTYSIKKATSVTLSDGSTGVRLSGEGEPLANLVIFIYSVQITGEIISDADGKWSYIVDSVLDDGAHRAYIAKVDSNGNIITRSEEFTFTKIGKTIIDPALDPANAPMVSNNTNTIITSTTATLAVNTDRPAKCEFNKGGGFTFGNGTGFSTTGGYSHNNDLIGLTNGNYTYYVVCQDAATKAASNAFKIAFAVNLAEDDNFLTVSNITAAKQTGIAPVLAVTTNFESICRYSTTSGFSFANGTPMTTNDNYSHSVSIAALADATYTFYAICKDNNKGMTSSQLEIITTLDRPDTVNSQPEITNITAGYQTNSEVILSVTTKAPANCQYSKTSFAYGNGTAFSTTGSTAHGAVISGLTNGNYSYHVVCKDLASGETNSDTTPIIFTVAINNGASACASLVSNDRVNDSDRSALGSGKNDSSYLWQAVEKGTREKFDKVDWFAGYQFSVGEDGTATELCAYFTKGQANDVYLYDGSYKELAKTSITGTGDWACADINPVNLNADARYYVITKINNQSIYYEYKSGFLPVDTGKAVIEAGIRQSVNNIFNKDIVKYDYMIFGLVDVKVSYNPESSQGPDITSTSPSGTIHDSSAFLSVETDKGATCKFGRDDVDFADMPYQLQEMGDGTYNQKVCDLINGNFTFYVRCGKDGKINNASTQIKFTVND